MAAGPDLSVTPAATVSTPPSEESESPLVSNLSPQTGLRSAWPLTLFLVIQVVSFVVLAAVGQDTEQLVRYLVIVNTIGIPALSVQRQAPRHVEEVIERRVMNGEMDRKLQANIHKVLDDRMTAGLNVPPPILPPKD